LQDALQAIRDLRIANGGNDHDGLFWSRRWHFLCNCRSGTGERKEDKASRRQQVLRDTKSRFVGLVSLHLLTHGGARRDYV
jgi:hypothetical protein